jgi:sulfatase modifying factor 1
MKRNKIFSLLAALLGLAVGLPAMGQGVIVYKKDGTFQKFPYEQVDSIVTYNYDDPDPVMPGGAGEYTVNGVTFKMVAVKGGTFTMGATSEQSNPSSDEKPVHTVTLSDFAIGETEVTQELWQAVMGTNPSYFIGNLQRPVEQVSWNDCQTFIEKLNELTGMQFSLPTEAQWEYAARGGASSQGYQYSGSNTLADVAWYTSNSSSTTHPVKSKQANELGLYDMSGNVVEWCQDWYGSYSSSSQTDPTGFTSGSYRVLRGGGWIYSARNCRVANRDYDTPSNRYYYNGLRLALSSSY